MKDEKLFKEIIKRDPCVVSANSIFGKMKSRQEKCKERYQEY